MDYYALVIAEARDRYRAALEDIASLNGDAREQCADIARRALRGEQGEP